MAKRDGVEIRYYAIIYELADDIRALLTGMLSPILRENILGYAEIREVFTITKVGKVAGCRVAEGIVRRGGKVRLLRDNVVIHEGELSQLGISRKTCARFAKDSNAASCSPTIRISRSAIVSSALSWKRSRAQL